MIFSGYHGRWEEARNAMRYMHDDIDLLPGCQLPTALMVLTLFQDWNGP